jgi:hypothetical protein
LCDVYVPMYLFVWHVCMYLFVWRVCTYVSVCVTCMYVSVCVTCMYVCICLCDMSVCMYLFVWRVCMYVSICVTCWYVYVGMYVCMYVPVCATCIYACACECIHVRMEVNATGLDDRMHTHTNAYIYIHTSWTANVGTTVYTGMYTHFCSRGIYRLYTKVAYKVSYCLPSRMCKALLSCHAFWYIAVYIVHLVYSAFDI